MKAYAKTPEEQAAVIETKRSLLTYLRSGPQHLTIESYLCLTNMLSQAGWNFNSGRWTRDGCCLATLEAAILELERQLASDRDRLLRQTVTAFHGPSTLPEPTNGPSLERKQQHE
jgi:hypothetical protein